MKYLFGTILLIITVSILPVGLYSRSPGDSLLLLNDSLQDVRIDKILRDIEVLKRNWDKNYVIQEQKIDSLRHFIVQLEKDILSVREDNRIFLNELSIIKENFETQIQDSKNYRARMAAIMWISGPVILFLLFASVLFTFLVNRKLKTMLLKRLQTLDIETGDSLRLVKKDLSEENKIEMKRIKKDLRRQVKKDIKERIKGLTIKKK
ncbi:MAG TPA: hypothetical protein ENN61_04810 [Bacteroidaceae bacterium]|nr:hypothetical protein [Bacteroidaceae bacterium]